MDYRCLIPVILCPFFFLLGYEIKTYLSKKNANKIDNEIDNTLKDLHCFECEIDMLVKEKNGRLFCSNCKTPHYIISNFCAHDATIIKNLKTVLTCETTVVVCKKCGKELSDPKTEC